MRWFKITTLAILTATMSAGCSTDERKEHVSIIVPDEFHGVFCIKFTVGAKGRPKEDATFVFTIPDNGILDATGVNPFSEMGTISAAYQSGDEITNAATLFANNVSPDPHDTLYRTVGGTNAGDEFWGVVGTEAEEQAARLLLHDFESQRNQGK